MQTTPPAVGIDKISFYTSNFYLDLSILAKQNNVEVNKYYNGLGQEKMGIPAHDEDIVTLAANAADAIVGATERDNISSVFFATESSIDQSKAAGIYVHRLLKLKSNCRVVELKQACYSCAAAVQMACALVARNPTQSVLVIASDVARYELGSAAEPTQGCGAVAMLIKANPRILQIQPQVGNYTEDVMDFWRPNYRKTALVEGKFSTQMYIKAMLEAWDNYQKDGGFAFNDISHFCYHLPFTRMGQKAHRSLCQHNKEKTPKEIFDKQLADSLTYSRIIGNSYSASLFISLVSLLEQNEGDLSGKNIGFLSYGSGCVAEYFAGTVVSDYKDMLLTSKHKTMLDQREALSYEQYIDLWNYPEPKEGEEVKMQAGATGKFKLARIYEHKRDYIRA